MVGILLIIVAAAVGAMVGFGVWSTQDKPRSGPVLTTIMFGVVSAIVTAIVCSFTVIGSGTVGVVRTFGVVHERALPEGFHFVSPITDVTHMSVRRGAVDLNEGGDAPQLAALSADQNPVTVSVSLPYTLNPTVAWKIYLRIGSLESAERSVLTPAAQAATRDVIARMPWTQSSITGRTQAEADIRDEFQRAVVRDLTRLGFSDAEAEAAFTFLPVMLRDVRPDQKVLNSIAEKVAAEQDLQRQQILTQIARQEAERRANEGVGVSRLFSQLPSGFTADQISAVLYAMADKQRADALMKAVESGRVQTMVLPSGTPVAVTGRP